MKSRVVLWFLFLFYVWTPLQASKIGLSDRQAGIIAHKIWLNEGSGKRSRLVWWNKGEEFASVGIGHFIWYTADRRMWFWEAFPPMLRFLIDHGARPPDWLTPETPCVWNSYEAWLKARRVNAPKMRQLVDFMEKTMDLQARFMLHRLNDSFPKILAYASRYGQEKTVKMNYRRLLYRPDGSIDPHGAYILIDYINFKGDGINRGERYGGKGWGLYQVLTRMNTKDPDPYHAFAVAGKWVLERLTHIAPPERRLWRFRKGWFNRMNTYDVRMKKDRSAMKPKETGR